MKEVFTKFTYDGIGNRLTSTSPVLGDHTYTPNSLNQYATLTTGNSRTAVGRAPAAWNVQVAGVNASRIGEMFYRALTASNSAAPVWQDVIVRRDTGTPTMTQHFWHAKQSFSPTHDDDGNLTNDGRWAYSWDAENRLIQMETTTAATGAGHPYTRLQFAYDWQGHRIARHVWQGGTAGSPTFKSSHRWLYDGWNVAAEFTAPSATSTTLTPLNRFTWGLDLSGTLQGAGGVGGLLTINDQLSTINYAASYDGNGNIVAWTRSNATAPTSRREYDAFGNTLVSEGAAPCSFGFSTKMQDGETGLYYYGYRYYDPVTGRWPSKDPIEEEGGENLYGFVFNSPLYYSDYLGREPQDSLESRHPIRVVVGNVASALTGDLFHDMSKIPAFDGKQCEFLITVSGILMKDSKTGEDTQRDYHNRVKSLPGMRKVRNPAMVNNPSNGPGGMLDYIQILLNEVPHVMTRPDLDMVRQIEAAANKAKENHCCCWNINVVAHSQGTMIFKRSLALVSAETKRHINYIGLGGEAILHSGMGLGTVHNIAHKNDFVPKLQSANWRYFREEIDTDTSDPHSWEKTYLSYLEANPKLTKKGKFCE